MADFLAKLEEEEAKLAESSSVSGGHTESDSFRTKLQLASANSPTLDELDLKYANITAENLRALRRALKKNTHVVKIDLTGNSMRSETFKAVCRLISSTKCLLDLDLRFCDIEKEMGPNLVEAIKSRAKEGFAPLREVHLDGNFISANDLKDISSLLSSPAKAPNRSSLSERTTLATAGKSASMDASTDALVRQLQAKLQTEKRRAEEAQKEEARLREKLSRLEEEMAKKALEEKKKHKDEAKKSKITLNTKNLKIMDRLYTSGSGAQIYSCLVDGWQCAMKELVVDPLVPDHVILSFETEIAIAERLPYHPHVIRYLFHEKTGDKLRLFMTKYNLALRAVLSRRRAGVEDNKPAKPFSPRQVASLMVQITSGLEFLHKNKVMHRDVKPDNILCLLNSVGDIDLLAITDFDSAKLLTRSTSAKTTVGTPAYMAPEVMSSSNKDPYSFKADVWSVGMVLYELMTLKMPYEDEEASRLVGMIQEGRRPSLDKIPTGFGELITVFKACTMVEPEDRPEMTDVREKLQQIEWALENGDD